MMTPNQTAFLTTVSHSEGTSASPATKCDGFDVIVTGIDGKPEVFTDFSAHPFANGRPPKVINSKGLKSDAAGRYQFMLHDWAHYKAQLNLPDFSPASQDKWALQLIRECRALPMIELGQFDQAIAACAHLWASLPGAGYSQPEAKLADLRAVYMAAGGVLNYPNEGIS